MASSSITPALKTSARSAYRALFRASGATFSGDDRVLHAFRDKVRTETIAGRQEHDPAEYEARVKHAFEVADVLKKNIVQGERQGEGDEGTWKLRITPDTELGSNETVKTPYSRPARGAPRTKCGEDPNAISPLPPRSLRHMAGSSSDSTRAYSTAVGSTVRDQEKTSEGAPTEEAKQEQLGAESYDKMRVEFLKSRLFEVNRRVLASPTGKDKVVERALVEDKLNALAARMEFLASETQAKIYQPSTVSDGSTTPRITPDTLVSSLVDRFPLNPKSFVPTTDPPVQLKQYARYLQHAAQHTIETQNAALSLPNPVRTAIGEVMETPAPNARTPDGALDELRALLWRILMVKRGMQRVVQAKSTTYEELAPMANSLGAVMRLLTYALQCIEDLEEHGPRSEDGKALLEEAERTIGGSIMFEMRREVERRLDAGIAWTRVQAELDKQVPVKGTLRKPGLRTIYHRLQRLEEELPKISLEHNETESSTRVQKLWRKKQLKRVAAIAHHAQDNLANLRDTLDRLESLHSENAEKVAPLREARNATEPAMPKLLEEACHSLALTFMVSRPWAQVLIDQLNEAERIVTQLRNADAHLRSYRRLARDDVESNKVVWELLLSAKEQLYTVYDAFWRLVRRLKQDIADMPEEKFPAKETPASAEKPVGSSSKDLEAKQKRHRENTTSEALSNIFNDNQT